MPSITGIKTLIDQSVTILSPSFKLFAPTLTIIGSMSIGFCVVTNEIQENREHLDTLIQQVANVEITVNNIDASVTTIEGNTRTDNGIDVTTIVVSILNRLDLLLDELQDDARAPAISVEVDTDAIADAVIAALPPAEIVEVVVPIVVTETVIEIVEVPILVDNDELMALVQQLAAEMRRLSQLHPDARIPTVIKRLQIVEEAVRELQARPSEVIINEITNVTNEIIQIIETPVPVEILDVICQDAATPPQGGPHAVDASEVCQ